jgi:hypothetical protein
MTTAKTLTALAVLSGFLAGQPAHTQEPDDRRPHWIVVATIIDRTTGRRLRQVKLGGPELEFEDAARCKTMLEKIRPVENEDVAAVLTCEKLPGRAVTYL